MGFGSFFSFIVLLVAAAHLSGAEKTRDIILSSGRRLTQTEAGIIEASTTDELQQALDDVQAGQTIVLTGDKYVLSTSLVIDKQDIRLEGTSPEATTLQCPENDGSLIIELEWQLHVLLVIMCSDRATNVTVSSLEIKGCKGFSAVTVEPADADASDGIVVFDRVAFRHNINDVLYSAGGAIFAAGCVSQGCAVLIVTIRDCVFEENMAEQGGAIHCEECSLEVINSVFAANNATSNGGAIHVSYLGTQLNVSHSRFYNNRVIEEGFPLVTYREDGLIIEHDQYFDFKSPGNGGGAIALVSAENLTLTNSTFLSNEAVSGGAVYATLDATELSGVQNRLVASITRCLFQENRAVLIEQTEKGDLENNLGGAIYFASATAKLSGFDIVNSWFRNNSAQGSGGALHIVTVFQDSVSIRGCTFERNDGGKAGGAALLRNSGEIEVHNSTWLENTAGLGGAIMLTNGAEFTALRTSDFRGEEIPEWRNRFEGNSAVDGGGLMCAGCGTLVLKNVNFSRNAAGRVGGGLFALDSSHPVTIEQSLFEGNAASHGGGAAFRAAAAVKFESAQEDWRNEFKDNMAVSGGGVFVEGIRPKENIFQMKNCRFSKNSAVNSSAIKTFLPPERPSSSRLLKATSISEPDRTETAGDESSAVEDSLRRCGNGGGGGICLAFDDVPDGAMADVGVTGTDFEDNQALVGGGMFVSIAGTWSDEKKRNCQSNALSIEPCRLFHLLSLAFKRNKARFGGGGLFVSDPQMTIVGCGIEKTDMKDWRALSKAEKESSPLSDCFHFEDNTVREFDGIYGPDMASCADSLLIVDPSSGVISDHRGGDTLLPPCNETTDCKEDRKEGIKIEVKDAFNQTITGGIPDASLTVIALSTDILGEQTYRAKNGTVNVNQTVGVGVNKTSFIEFKHHSSRGKDLKVNLTFTTRACLPGEEQTDTGCKSCPVDHYSFNSSSRCTECKEHAKCKGGSVLVPTDGYWHSTPFSPQFHECVNEDACVFKNRTKKLEKYYENATIVAQDLEELNQYLEGNGTAPEYENYEQCADGYKSILCGSCRDGYGRSGNGECQKCPPDWRFALTRKTICFLVSIILIITQVKTSLFSLSEDVAIVATMTKDAEGRNRQRKSLKLAAAFPENTHPRPTDPTGSGSSAQSHPHIKIRIVARIVQWFSKIKKREPLVTDHIIARDKLTETLKIFVNYMQVTTAALSIRVPWFAPIRYLLSGLSFLTTFANGILYVPLECIIFRIDSHTVTSLSKPFLFWLRVLVTLMSLPLSILVQRMTETLFTTARETQNQPLTERETENPFGQASRSSTRSSPGVQNRENAVASPPNGADQDGDDEEQPVPRASHEDLQKQRAKASRDTVAEWIVVILVFIFQSYSTIIGAFMQAVNCINVDEDQKETHDLAHDYSERYAIETESRVWVEDTSIYCYQGKHFITAMAGSAGLAFSLLFIFWIFFWMYANKKRLKNVVFIKRYGFLYNSYKRTGRGPYWEGVIFLRKAAIQASIVYAIRLDANLQAASALGVLLVALVAHLIARPFEVHEDHPNIPEYCGRYLEKKGILPAFLAWAWRSVLGAASLNSLEGASLIMSISVFYCGIISNNPNASEAAKDAVAVCAWAANVLFILYMLHRLYAGAHLALDMQATYLTYPLQEGEPDPPGIRTSEAPSGRGLIKLYRKRQWIRVYLRNCPKAVARQERALYDYLTADRT